MSNAEQQLPPVQEQVPDNRRPALGLGRIVMAIFWLFGAWTLIVSIRSLIGIGGEPLGPALVSLLAALIYLTAAIALTHNGRRMRMVGWASVGISLAGPILTGLLGVGTSEVSAEFSPWSRFGEYYYYLPLVIPVIGLVWLWWSNPRRIVEIAEQVETTRTAAASKSAKGMRNSK